jgi:hypothetical protein
VTPDDAGDQVFPTFREALVNHAGWWLSTLTMRG